MPEVRANPLNGPIEVSDALMAFPGSVMHLLPSREDIPDDKWSGRGPWAELAERWFGRGLPKAYPAWKDGIDGKAALRHLKCCFGSFEPKHEHKIGGIAMLLEAWCNALLVVDKDGSGRMYTSDAVHRLSAEEVAGMVQGEES